ncbi:DUF6891 domain-containing protein [Spirillospora sp. NPDC048911]|uniref:DUF6891 domain-containing protein n=1 Tax=Spirillospora sp. NPDC048911 TaxID=3364527 RepID=UPI0037134A3F
MSDAPLARLRAYAANLDEEFDDIEDLAEELRAHAEEHDLTVSEEDLLTVASEEMVRAKARILVCVGYSGHDNPITPEDIVDEMVEMVEEAEADFSPDAIEDIVDGLWQARVEEQREWPEVTDNDLLERAFADLWNSGIVAEENFTCCQGCGVSEIRGEIPEGSVMDGYAFFHQQDTESVVLSGRLLLSYGTFGSEPDEQKAAGIGERVVAALNANGLRTEWNGSTAKRITVFMEWRNRLLV